MEVQNKNQGQVVSEQDNKNQQLFSYLDIYKYNYTQMDNYSNNSQQQSDIFSIQPQRPKNRNKFMSKGLCLSSDFSGGNLHTVAFKDQIITEGKLALLIEFYANSDTNSDLRDKAWFYFNLSGIRETRNLKYSHILFRFKNANIYRKFIRQKKYKPYVAVKQYREKNFNEWKTILLSKITQPGDNQPLQAQFIYKIQPGVDRVSFASNFPYSLADFQTANRRIIDYLDTTRNSMIYYHREIIAESADCHPVYMLTITSTNNVASYNQQEPEIWPHKGQRPHLLKNKPEIVFTARVHPSEISSSFCIEGIIQSLVKNTKLSFLLTAFIFRIIPIMNPDGVENGHYRLDNFSQNLNRFYGHSDHTKTPSIYAVQKLLVSLREKSKLFFFMDIHGHNSPKPSFIFGNYSQNFYHSLENKTFARIMETLSQQKFSFLECEFSKRNMSVKQKYDEHSKEASARVFAYQGNWNGDNYQLKNVLSVEHSYTLQVHPYLAQNLNIPQTQNQVKEVTHSLQNLSILPTIVNKQQVSNINPSFVDIIKEYKKLGQNVLISILELIGANIDFKLLENESGRIMRRKCLKEIIKLPEHYDRFKKQREKQRQINQEIFDRYYKKWNIIQSFKEYINSRAQEKDINIRQKFAQYPIYQAFQQQLSKKDSIKRLSPLKTRSESQTKSKQKLIQKQRSSIMLIGERQLNFNYESQQGDLKQTIDLGKTPNFAVQKVKVSQQEPSLALDDKMLEKFQNFYINSQVRNSPRLVNYTPTFNVEKRDKKSGEIQNLGELEKRAKRLIFRHKTQIQTKDSNQPKNKKVLLRVELSSLERSSEKSNLKSQKYLLQADYPFVRNLQPLSKKKSKEIRLKIGQDKDAKHNLNNILFKSQNSNRRERLELKTRIVSTQNPKIQELLKRVSLSKEQEKELVIEDEDMRQINRIKGTRTILSNLILLKSKSKITKGLSNSQKQDIIHSVSNNCVVYDTNNSLIPLMHQSKIYQELVNLSEGQNLVKTGLQGSYRSISPIAKKQGGAMQGEIRQITSMQVFKKNNLQFLEKAKNELVLRRKVLKSIQR